MTPQQFLASIRQGNIPPACLLLGPESYQRDYCRRVLIEAFLSPEERESGITRHDLEETSLEAVLEDACSLSLFAPRRLIHVRNAEAALPRGRVAQTGEEGEPAGEAAALAAYMAHPVESVVLVFEAGRYGFEGEDQARLERVRKFYAAVPAIVECAPLKPEQARAFARALASRAGLQIGEDELETLVEALGAEAARIAMEIEKLRLWAAGGKKVSAADVAALVPEARSSNLYELVDALAVRDRAGALKAVEVLARQGDYLPLALSMLASLFRLALVARQVGWSRPEQIMAQASNLGIRMWRARAQQVHRTASAFSAAQLISALKLLYAADKALRDARPDDQVTLEAFIFRLTS